MSRIWLATFVGLTGFVLYVAGMATLADRLPDNGWVQLIYYSIAGFLWVLPARWLMLWSVHQR